MAITGKIKAMHNITPISYSIFFIIYASTSALDITSSNPSPHRL